MVSFLQGLLNALHVPLGTMLRSKVLVHTQHLLMILFCISSFITPALNPTLLLGDIRIWRTTKRLFCAQTLLLTKNLVFWVVVQDQWSALHVLLDTLLQMKVKKFQAHNFLTGCD
jgi:hypothetical protein